MRFGWIAAIVASGAAAPVEAQETAAPEGFSISGTTRFRIEAIDGQARAGFNESDRLVNLRTTLLGEYREGPVRIAAELWDSRVYGGNAGSPISSNEVNTMEFVQAFAEVRARGLLGSESTASFQVGRFLLNLGARRLVAADDYRNTTNGYTGVRTDLGWRGGWRATLIYTLPQQRRPDFARVRRNAVALDREGFDLVLWGGLVSKVRAIGPVTPEFYFFHLGERDRPGRPTRDRSLDTIALRLMTDPAPGRVDVELEGALQTGQVSTSLSATAPRQQVRAWFLHADAGITLAAGWKPRVAIEYDHASGDGPGETYGRFDTLFGMRRADLAPSGIYNAFGRTNFISPGLRVEAAPDARTDVMMTLRPLWLAAREDSFSTTGVRDPTGRSGSYAGTQFDARLRHRLSSGLRLELDTVLLAKGRFLREAPNAPPGRWTRYVSLNATAAF